MSQVPPTSGEGGTDPQDPGPPAPPPAPGGYPPAPPPGVVPPPGGVGPDGPPPSYGAPPPYGASGYGAAPPFGSPPPYGASGYGAPAPYASPAGALAGYGARLGGWLLDWIIVTAVSVVVTLPLHVLHRSYTYVNSVREVHVHISLGGEVIFAVFAIGYGTVLCGSPRGQTVGMMAARTRVVSADVGGPIGYPRALGRALFEYVMAIVLLIPWVVDMLFPLWDRRNQTLHDKVANTVVVKT